MRILALDLSKRSTGWACFSDEDERPSYGHWQLGSEYTSKGKVFLNLHQHIVDIHRLGEITHFFYEDSLMQTSIGGKSNIETVRLLSGLCMHTESIAEALGARVIVPVNMMTWRKCFIGSQPRKSKRVDLKAMVMERCRQFGFTPRNDDEGDALGILDYACDHQGIIPSWRRDNVLLPPVNIR